MSAVPRLLEKVYDSIIAKGTLLTGIKKKLFFWAIELGLRYEPYGANGWWYEFQLKIARKLIFSKWKEGLGGNLDLMVSGSAALQTRLARIFAAAEIPVMEGYGLTECCPLVTVSPYDLTGFNGSIGLPAPSTDIRLVDEDGNDVAAGEPGEMLVKGPQVMLGYLNRPEETAKVLKDGWLYTGDIARMDEEGFFYIVDRKKDMILVSGFNVYPNEIEEVVAMHDKVLEVAAVGVPNEATGEAVKLFIVKKDASLTEQEIIQHCRQQLTGYKVPKLVEFRAELPKTNVGKILRRELRG